MSSDSDSNQVKDTQAQLSVVEFSEPLVAEIMQSAVKIRLFAFKLSVLAMVVTFSSPF